MDFETEKSKNHSRNIPHCPTQTKAIASLTLAEYVNINSRDAHFPCVEIAMPRLRWHEKKPGHNALATLMPFVKRDAELK